MRSGSAGLPVGQAQGMVSLAIATGSLVFLLFIVLLVVAVIFGLYSRTGTDMAQRPSDGLAHGEQAAAPGASAPDRITGTEEGEQDRFDTHGTR